MPRKEVEAILGGPPTGPTSGDEQGWQDGDKYVTVYFDKDGRAYAALYSERSRMAEWWWRLRRLLP